MPGQCLGAVSTFDAGSDTRLNKDFDKGCIVALLLTNGFVAEDCAPIDSPSPEVVYNQVAVCSSGFDGLRDSELFEALVTGSVALIHGKQTLVIGEEQSSRFLISKCEFI